MPPALDADKEAVRVLVVAVGVREAARQCNLNENTVLSWADKGNWLQSVKDAKARKAQSIQAQRDKANRSTEGIVQNAIQSVAIKPADALAETMADLSKDTKLGLAKAAKKIADHAQTLTGEEALSVAPKLKDSASFASTVHGWAGADSGSKVQINIFSDPREKQSDVINLSE